MRGRITSFLTVIACSATIALASEHTGALSRSTSTQSRGKGGLQHADTDFQTGGCGAFSDDCLACASHPDCGFCADGAYYADNEEVLPGSHIGGWIFRQKGLQGEVDEGTSEAAGQAQGVDVAASLERASKVIQAAQASILEIERQTASTTGALEDASAQSSAERKMASRDAKERTATRALLLELEGKIEAARETLDGEAENSAEDFSSLLELSSRAADDNHNGPLKRLHEELHQTLGRHSASAAKKTKGAAKHAKAAPKSGHHLFGCYNRTAAKLITPSSTATTSTTSLAASLPRYSLPGHGICIDFRTDVCDCEGAEQSLPDKCGLAMAEVKTPGVLVFAAFGAAALVVTGMVAVQVSYTRESCERGRSKEGKRSNKRKELPVPLVEKAPTKGTTAEAKEGNDLQRSAVPAVEAAQ
jgi:hypothetical protein